MGSASPLNDNPLHNFQAKGYPSKGCQNHYPKALYLHGFGIPLPMAVHVLNMVLVRDTPPNGGHTPVDVAPAEVDAAPVAAVLVAAVLVAPAEVGAAPVAAGVEL